MEEGTSSRRAGACGIDYYRENKKTAVVSPGREADAPIPSGRAVIRRKSLETMTDPSGGRENSRKRYSGGGSTNGALKGRGERKEREEDERKERERRERRGRGRRGREPL